MPLAGWLGASQVADAPRHNNDRGPTADQLRGYSPGVWDNGTTDEGPSRTSEYPLKRRSRCPFCGSLEARSGPMPVVRWGSKQIDNIRNLLLKFDEEGYTITITSPSRADGEETKPHEETYEQGGGI